MWLRIASHSSDVCNASSDRFTGRQSSRLWVNDSVLRRSHVQDLCHSRSTPYFLNQLVRVW